MSNPTVSIANQLHLRIRMLSLTVVRLTGLALLVGVMLWGFPTPRAEGATTVVQVGDFWFCNSSYAFGGVCPTTVSVGDTVEWDFNSAIFPHTTTDCGPTDCATGPVGNVWDSGTIVGGGGTFQFTFTTPGVYPYYCVIHPNDMFGEITVTSAVGGIAQLPLESESGAPLAASAPEVGVSLALVAGVAAAGAVVIISLTALVRRRLLE